MYAYVYSNTSLVFNGVETSDKEVPFCGYRDRDLNIDIF